MRRRPPLWFIAFAVLTRTMFGWLFIGSSAAAIALPFCR